jgi:HSP20 family protein
MDNDLRRGRGLRDPGSDMASSRVGRFGLLPSLLEEFFEPQSGRAGASGTFTLDIEETPTSYIVYADLPGISKSDIQVELHENTLTISAERKEEHSADGNVVWRERSYGKLNRSVQLPQAVDDDSVEATHVDGALRLVLAKQAVKNTKRISIS